MKKVQCPQCKIYFALTNKVFSWEIEMRVAFQILAIETMGRCYSCEDSNNLWCLLNLKKNKDFSINGTAPYYDTPALSNLLSIIRESKEK